MKTQALLSEGRRRKKCLERVLSADSLLALRVSFAGLARELALLEREPSSVAAR